MTLFALNDATTSDGVLHRGQWRLSRIEVVNWGTFDGFHAVDVARKGHLVTGASGSGKSSLLDAIAAVLTPKGAVTFNAAAQESVGRASDRTWVTYVRGAWSREADEIEDRTVATYLRTNATWSGILLRFENEEHDPVSLIRLFHLRGTSTDSSDLKEMNVITRTLDGLMTYAPYASGGIDARRLEADHHPVIVTTTGKHGGYFQRLQRLLGIGNETALQLLHKTQAAKNLGTLDTLFRKFMLDEPPTFKRADSAVEQFGELRDAYDHVVDLRRQRDALLKVSNAAEAYEKAQAEATSLSDLADAVQPFAVSLQLDLSRKALIDANTDLAKAAAHLTKTQKALNEAEEQLTAARDRVNALGGRDLAPHQARINDAKRALQEVLSRRGRLANRLTGAGLQMAETEGEYADLCTMAREALLVPVPDALDHALLERLSLTRKTLRELESDLKTLNLHKSNMNPRLLNVRDQLCRDLNIPQELMPFAGELISVRHDHAQWSGAIERALAPIATALLVRDDEIAAVRKAVNERHLGVNLTIDAVPSTSHAPLPIRDDRSLVYRVDVAEGIFAEYLNRRLSDEFDFTCVDSADELEDVSRGITVNGLIKRAARRYIKADRHDVNDRARWVLGGNIEPKRDELQRQLATVGAELVELDRQANDASADRDRHVTRKGLFEDVLTLPWSEIDAESAERRIATLQGLYDQVVSPDSDLGRASQAESALVQERDQLRGKAERAGGQRAVALEKQALLQASIDELAQQSIADLSDHVKSKLDEHFRRQQNIIRFDQVNAVAFRVQSILHAEGDKLRTLVEVSIAEFVERARDFNNEWRAIATNANLSSRIEDRSGYRDLLAGIQSRGLPEHEANFRRLLDTRSKESVTFLRDDLTGALRQIESRITPVNESLGRSPFDRDRYLNIRVRLRRTQEVKDFLGDLKSIVDGNWANEDFAAAEHRFAVLANIMHRLGSSDRVDREWRTRVLDTREHVSFIAEEVDRNGKVHNVHDSSAGLSGGQRQKLVVFCLAAALRYQLAVPEADFSNYGTVVLDEAFDKADADYTRMAMDIFVAFGFQMILATPGKLLQTLEPYIGAVTVVTNPDRKGSQLTNVEF
ncbi:ATP-binding protein [Microcella sp.]|uniref:ATP-binding protein n=1 Tax=Microcella sp. TaxID=1913979 RepID=UPI003F710D96